MNNKILEYSFMTIWNMFITLICVYVSVVYHNYWVWFLFLTYKVYRED